MNKLFTLCFLALLLALLSLSSASAQTIRRVNNNGITGTNIYTTIQAAHDAAANGDIIQVEPSTTGYGDLTCTKAVNIVGAGYFLPQNQPPALQASPIPATIGMVSFSTGSSGASMTGLITSTVNIDAGNILCQRNNIYTMAIGRTAAANNVVVRQNFINSIGNYTLVAYQSKNVNITNNIVLGQIQFTSASGIFSNNVVLNSSGGTNYITTFIAENNYFSSSVQASASTVMSNNMFSGNAAIGPGSSSNDITNTPASAVFVDNKSSYDTGYQLKPGTNPARGAGMGGTDIGAFGGSTGYGYRLSGIPAIPTIYQLDQVVTGNSLNITIGTRSNN